MRKRAYVAIALLVAILSTVIFYGREKLREMGKEVVNVYGWYGIISRSILTEFEKETGIRVVYDVFDNNDTLEAKLLATNSGYDVIFPSFIPYAARQYCIGAYIKLDQSQLPNMKNLETLVTRKFRDAGGDTDYLIPIFWGTTGIVYNYQTVLEAIGEEVTSYDVMFDADKISKLARYGVSFPEEFIDIFPQARLYWEIEGDSEDPSNLQLYKKRFQAIRQYIKKFSSNTVVNDLMTGEVCIAVCPSDNAWRAIRAAKTIRKDIRYVLPEDAGILWVDCMCIPQGAPHVRNAHKFINFLLQPAIAARITNESGIFTNILSASDLYSDEIRSDSDIFLTDARLERLIMGNPNKSEKDLWYDKEASRVWSQIRMNKFDK
ncbi:MAG: extracellular solute-binding protein [Holosporales bacterium]|jgi:putrescine transport system substrate-binding protein|nr:extracellular solute-binding protein [Holosporales bacterium]